MPTIDELAPAVAAGDGDLLPVSQGGVARSVTRAQLLAGVQAGLALPAGVLLGRTSAGVGGVEPIGVAAPLMLKQGVLSAPAPYSVGALPGGAAPGSADLVGVSQGGRDAAVPYGAVMAGLGSLSGIDLSQHVARVPGGAGRSFSDWVADAAPVEAYGALGDGQTDDTVAFDRAVASGRPIRLGPKVYVLNGQWTVAAAAVLIGVPGQSVLRRLTLAGGAWISVQGPSFVASGVDFDAGKVTGESWGVLVTPGCSSTSFEECVFRGALGASLGSGLTIQARDGVVGNGSMHRVVRCEARDNQVHGIWVQAAAGAVIEGCSAHGNGGYGICLDYNDAGFAQVARQGRVSGCRAWGNSRGISVGNYNEINAEPPRWGLGHPDVVRVLVAANVCDGNSAYGIAASGSGIEVSGNLVSVTQAEGAGVLMNAAQSRVVGNSITGPGGVVLGAFGVDAGGCAECEVAANFVQGFAVGVNAGGSQGMRVRDNQLVGNSWGVTIYNVETDGRGVNFGLATSALSIEGNRIVLRDGGGGGVYLLDAPQGVAVVRNAMFGGPGSAASQALWAHTDGAVVSGNSWDNQARVICNPVAVGGLQQVQVPDVLDEAMVTVAPQGVQSIVGQHQAAVAGQVTFVRVTAGGAGYSRAAVAISGAGSGAAGVAYVRDGVVIGVALSSGGSGYGAGGALVTITGDGSGATAVAQVGLPVFEGRRLRLQCNGAVRFKRAGSLPFQDNFTGTDMTVPAGTAVEWMGTWGGWQAVLFQTSDYVAPTGDGGVVVRSGAGGDVTLRPNGAGRVRIGSDTEPFGFVSALGHGSPEGVVSAPAGSDYRNLDGGVGATLWVKRSGAGAVGWFAVV